MDVGSCHVNPCIFMSYWAMSLNSENNWRFPLNVDLLRYFGLWKISILRSTYSVIPFFTLFSTAFCDLVRNKEFRATFENFHFFQNAAKLRRSTGGAIRSIIIAVRTRKWKDVRKSYPPWAAMFILENLVSSVRRIQTHLKKHVSCQICLVPRIDAFDKCRIRLLWFGSIFLLNVFVLYWLRFFSDVFDNWYYPEATHFSGQLPSGFAGLQRVSEK